jgi:hypothetical protein
MTDQGNQNPSTQNKGGQQPQQGNMPNKQNPQQTQVKSGQGSGTGSGNK